MLDRANQGTQHPCASAGAGTMAGGEGPPDATVAGSAAGVTPPSTALGGPGCRPPRAVAAEKITRLQSSSEMASPTEVDTAASRGSRPGARSRRAGVLTNIPSAQVPFQAGQDTQCPTICAGTAMTADHEDPRAALLSGSAPYARWCSGLSPSPARGWRASPFPRSHRADEAAALPGLHSSSGSSNSAEENTTTSRGVHTRTAAAQEGFRSDAGCSCAGGSATLPTTPAPLQVDWWSGAATATGMEAVPAELRIQRVLESTESGGCNGGPVRERHLTAVFPRCESVRRAARRRRELRGGCRGRRNGPDPTQRERVASPGDAVWFVGGTRPVSARLVGVAGDFVQVDTGVEQVQAAHEDKEFCFF